MMMMMKLCIVERKVMMEIITFYHHHLNMVLKRPDLSNQVKQIRFRSTPLCRATQLNRKCNEVYQRIKTNCKLKNKYMNSNICMFQGIMNVIKVTITALIICNNIYIKAVRVGNKTSCS